LGAAHENLARALEDGQNVDAQLRAVFSSAAALALDNAILFGTGSSNQPTGIANTSGIQSVSMGTNGAEMESWDPILDGIAALETANAGTVTGIVYAPRTARIINGLPSGTVPLMPPPRIAGVAQFATTAVPINQTQGSASNASTVLLGDWSEVYVGVRTQLQISTLTERYADNGQVGFVSWLRADVTIARPAAMAKIIGIVPAT
jgi:HK97 family phage major capsid protein